MHASDGIVALFLSQILRTLVICKSLLLSRLLLLQHVVDHAILVLKP